jgi:hypothetical protein
MYPIFWPLVVAGHVTVQSMPIRLQTRATAPAVFPELASTTRS